MLKRREKYFIWFDCDFCGKSFKAYKYNVKYGHTKSCGCIKGAKGHNARTHGLCSTPEYRAFHKAKGRRQSMNDYKYSDYGGRGILFKYNSLSEFLDDLGLRPSSSHSLNRVDNSGNYGVGNCNWSTPREQANNRRPRRAHENAAKI